MSNQQNESRGEIVLDEEDGREITVGALAALNSSEINQQIMTAKAYPRDITSFRKKVLTFATMDEDIAKSCMYALQRRDSVTGENKAIEGPSARFAEIVAQTWGNCRAGARVVEIGDTHITAQGFFYDLENNVAISYEVMRRIVGKVTKEHPEGKRFGADMIGVTGNAACSIALRNAVFKGVPKAYWNHGYLAARATVAGDMATIGERRTKLLKAFDGDFGVKPEQIYALVGIKGAPDITLDHMVFLGGLHNAIKEGETTVERAFDPENFARTGTGGIMTPAAPNKSEFKAPDKPAGEKPAAQSEPKTAEAAKDVVAQNEPAQDRKADLPVDEAKAAREKEYAEWFEAAKARLLEQENLKDLSKLYDELMPNVMGDDRMRDFTATFDARHKAILDGSRKPSNRGK